ncbi:hypothetical protein [Actinoplanes sp. NPDC051494]|uniref:hypothetical protein n=1 Tax=Actinoplanes sp. NPDC051494 TaxID=3363907 RepID=UPI0037917B88
MDKPEVVLLLTLAGTFDYRRVGDADVEAWHLALDDIDFVDAKAAVVAHYRATRDRLMPVDVRQGVRTIRDARHAQEPTAARQLPGRFEDDADRADRARRGAAPVHAVIAEIAQRMQQRADHVPGAAMNRLRELTDGPAWADSDEAGR